MHNETADVPLTAEAVSGVLGPSAFVRNVFAFDSVDSTNAYAKTLIGQGKTDSALIVAEKQTQGRGRLGRQWHSERWKNLTFSLIVKPEVPAGSIGVLTLCVAESLASAVQTHLQISLKTKWPNDLLIDGKKVCGILMESVMMGEKVSPLVIGIGLNVNQRNFPSDLDATSLSLSTGKPVDRLTLLSEIVRKLAWLDRPVFAPDVEKKLEQWKARCEMFGTMIRVQTGEKILSGIARGIGEDGGLVLDVNGTEQKVLAGDVTVLEVDK